MLDAQWITSVESYLHRLDGAVNSLAIALDDFDAHTAEGNFNALGEPATATAEAAASLEALLDERAALLAQTESDGRRARSLRGALESSGRDDLVASCEHIGARIEEQRLRSIRSFVTQFHLAETGQQLVRILTRSQSDPGTYGPKAKSVGGGLLDEAA